MPAFSVKSKTPEEDGLHKITMKSDIWIQLFIVLNRRAKAGAGGVAYPIGARLEACSRSQSIHSFESTNRISISTSFVMPNCLASARDNFTSSTSALSKLTGPITAPPTHSKMAVPAYDEIRVLHCIWTQDPLILIEYHYHGCKNP
jgi:hypothetical protein